MQFANLSQKEQKNKLSAINKENFIADLLSARPKDYQERNWFYHQLSIILSYPLQFISILAGSYLLFDLAKFIWHIEIDTIFGLVIFIFCMLLFFGIEALRRWLVNTSGYHFLATFRREQSQLIQGEWLKTKMYILILISCILVTSGTFGAYQYTKHNKPKAATIDIKNLTAGLESKIKDEKIDVEKIDRNLKDILNAKKNTIADKKSYAIWEGNQYLLPEIKSRLENYDKQLQALTSQREKHQNLLHRFEEQRHQKEQKAESKNTQIVAESEYSTEIYAGACAGIWLSFECMLVFLLSYSWTYKYGVKREVLLSQLDMKKKAVEVRSFQTETLNTIKSEKVLPKSMGFGFSENNFKNSSQNHKSQVKEETKSEIGFKVIAENLVHQPLKKTELNTQNETDVLALEIESKVVKKEPIKNDVNNNTFVSKPQIIIQEVPVEVIKQVFVEKEVRVEVPIKDPDEGFLITCSHCGKVETKKRKAKFCSDKCRHAAWKEAKN
ncbi:MAG: zinc finger MYND domain-containing protein [Bacteroidetes bacterium]|nr:MAG: zinc finger MYND domain-containing protein [Bacteroidota bacterium]TAG90715.1 MAG: zinc finger MYND domain-containing protein [Bacteroidota bacterium]